MVFTCLSHDIVAHETTHALLDGLHRRYQEQTNPDVLAFHEAFADLVAIFQHFTFPELLRLRLKTARGDLRRATCWPSSAQAIRPSWPIGQRQSIAQRYRHKPEPRRVRSGAQNRTTAARVLVAAVFDAFLAIYKRRTQDLMRLATGGSGILRPGALHPDLVGRLADRSRQIGAHVLKLSIRALDYMPPVDPALRRLPAGPDHRRLRPGAGRPLRLPRRLYRGVRRRGIRRRRPDAVAGEPALADPATTECSREGLDDFIRERYRPVAGTCAATGASPGKQRAAMPAAA